MSECSWCRARHERATAATYAAHFDPKYGSPSVVPLCIEHTAEMRAVGAKLDAPIQRLESLSGYTQTAREGR